jgi:hypothetical protein
VRNRKAILQLAIAALLVSGAAICAVAQSGQAGKHNSREKAVTAQGTGEQGTGVQQKQAAPPEADKQNARENVAVAAASAAAPAKEIRYSYEFTQPEFFLRHIIISHDEHGRGQISFERKGDDAAIVDPIELSPAALGRVKALWDALRFWEADAVYQSEREMPHLGTMRLGMERDGRTKTVTFNWTQNTDAFALVNEYRRLADQAMFVFNITLARENQPLEAPKLMDELAKLYKRNGLSDPQQLLPLLRELSNDERIPLIARNHAGRLVKQIEK